MASGNKISAEHETRQGDSVENTELERVKKNLEEVTRKNQDLEEMLLYTTQELEKEKENSRKIVQTLTERLMESREMINKLEVENMRYKKDCMLAVELLQCNRSVTQAHVSTAVKKLSAYTEPVVHVPYPTEKPAASNSIPDDKRNVQPTRPRTLSKKKSKSVARDEDATALLAKQDANEPKIMGQVEGTLIRQDKVLNQDTSHKDLGENQLEKMPEKTSLCAIPATMNSNQQKQSDDSQGTEREGMNVKSSVNIGHYLTDEKQCLTKGKGHQREDERLIAIDQSKNTYGHDDQYRVEPEGANEEESCPKSECLNDEWSQEENPLLINEGKSLIQQHCDTSQERENSKAQASNMYPKENKKTGLELSSDFTQSTSLISTIRASEDVNHIKAMQEDTTDDEHHKLLTLDAETSEEKSSQKNSTGMSERTFILEDNRTQTYEDEAEAMASNEVDKTSLVNSLSKEIKSNDGGISTVVPENVDDETLTGEEDTPLV